MNTSSSTPHYIVLRNLEGYPPASLSPLQASLAPFAPFMESFWWGLWLGTFIIVVGKFILIPLVQKLSRK